ncbi:hypothetical protein [Leptolyngbya ohadii]|uniref:hypothetical protein n=1 Tax=Leptolyngbya ohadii TaxID=1962290 RepID=UPI000B59CE42|nr:hypothetical protein [Leptolyngbya ohadii]
MSINKLAPLAFGLLLSSVPLDAQAVSIAREVDCYYFNGTKLETRDTCIIEEFDTSSTLIRPDGAVNRVFWGDRDVDTPELDGVPAREYERDRTTLEIVQRPFIGLSMRCFQAEASEESVCWSN